VNGTLAILAGEGRLPVVLAARARAGGRRVLAIQVRGASPQLAEAADVYVRTPLGEVGRLLALLQGEGVTEVLLAGRFSRAAVHGDLAGGDAAARRLLETVRDRGDQPFLSAVASALGRWGIRVGEQLAYVGDLLAPPGVLAGPPPAPEEAADVQVAVRVARHLADLEVGQTVVVKGGAVLAVEAAEGTDEAIRRGGSMAPGAVVAKVGRTQQDPRFDVPTVGPDTVATLAAVRARVLALEAHRTILLDPAEVRHAAQASGITVVAVDAPPLRPRDAEAGRS